MITTDTKFPFPWEILTQEDYKRAQQLLGSPTGETAGHPRDADLVLAPDGKPYLYRWNVTLKDDAVGGQVYFHIQVASDPERPLHDHPWDNFSVILAGGYDEIISKNPASRVYDVETLRRRKGETIYRKAEVAHRLVLPADFPYTMTLFACGPVRKDWGFWVDKAKGTHDAGRNWEWVPSKVLINQRRINGISVQADTKVVEVESVEKGE